MPEIQVIPVSANDFIARWKEVAPLLDKAMPIMLARYESIDILAMVITSPQATQGWFAMEDQNILAVMVTQVCQYPRKRVLSMFCLGGERMNEWFKKGYQLLLEHGKRTGCQQFEVLGRPGWQKQLDLEPRSTLLVKELTPDGGKM